MFNYFAHCDTVEDIKREFHRLAMLHHPDHGGDTRTPAGWPLTRTSAEATTSPRSKTTCCAGGIAIVFRYHAPPE